MKKLLLATTCFGLFAAGTASATAPTIKLGGYADFQTGAADQEAVYESSTNAAKGSDTGAGTYNPLKGPINTSADTLLFVDVEGETDFGLTYGAHITLEADVSGSGDEGFGKTFIFAETAYGRGEAGATTSPAYAMQVGAETLARGTGGIGGDFTRYIDLDGSTGNTAGGRSFYAIPGLYNDAQPDDVDNNLIGGRRTANKYALYSPEFYGFQVGGSFTPDTNERGSVTSFTGTTEAASAGGQNTHYKNVFDFGGKYKAQYTGFGVEASATGQVGEAKAVIGVPGNVDDLRSFNFGLIGSFAGISLGGSYGFADEIGRAVALGAESEYFTAGGAYVYGPFGASVTYLDSTIENDGGVGMDSEFQNVVVSADYQLAPGFVPYVEVSFYETDDNDGATTDNEGTVFLSGIALTF